MAIYKYLTKMTFIYACTSICTVIVTSSYLQTLVYEHIIPILTAYRLHQARTGSVWHQWFFSLMRKYLAYTAEGLFLICPWYCPFSSSSALSFLFFFFFIHLVVTICFVFILPTLWWRCGGVPVMLICIIFMSTSVKVKGSQGLRSCAW